MTAILNTAILLGYVALTYVVWFGFEWLCDTSILGDDSGENNNTQD